MGIIPSFSLGSPSVPSWGVLSSDGGRESEAETQREGWGREIEHETYGDRDAAEGPRDGQRYGETWRPKRGGQRRTLDIQTDRHTSEPVMGRHREAGGGHTGESQGETKRHRYQWRAFLGLCLPFSMT